MRLPAGLRRRAGAGHTLAMRAAELRTRSAVFTIPAAFRLLLILIVGALISCASGRERFAADPETGRPGLELQAGTAEQPDAPAAGSLTVLAPGGKAAEDTKRRIPIVLVHGFGGWGRDDVPGLYYWGGFTDLQKELRGAGYAVYTASIGPFSSNWDRACELYAFIKGGRVDYGAHHSASYSHGRYGTTYPGVYPEWDTENPVQLIGHSMGGQTARLLAHLLRHGDPDERSTSGEGCHALFEEGGQWIKSITTISTPHNGTTLVNDIDIIDAIIQATILGITTAVESNLFPHFDLKMEQWGITRRSGEPLSAYFSRLRNQRIWSTTERDFSLWDSSLEGAAALNRRAAAEPDIYYFSYANEETKTGPVRSYQIPEIGMFAALIPGAVFLGSYIEEGATDESWWINDGVVNTCSMKAPRLESRDTVVEYDGSPEPGEWNYMGVLESMDHFDVIGILSADDSVIEFYLRLCEMLTRLPAPVSAASATVSPGM